MQLRLPGLDDSAREPPAPSPIPAPCAHEPPSIAPGDQEHEAVEAQACALNASLEAALLRELQQAYRQIDASLFRNSLRPVVLELSSAQSFLGRWHAASRTIEIARSFAVHHPWTSVLEVLKHEMAHQYVDEVLGEPNAGHGAAFRDVCARFRIDPRASGVPDSRTPGADEERVLARVARLLALADSPNENEAHAAMSAAQRLMLRYNIDQAAAASQDRRYGFRQVGRITGRIQESERLLGALLVDHFFVDAIWVPAYEPSTGRSGSVLEICGTPANLEMADYVHAFLTHTAQHSWEAHQKAARTTSNRDRQTFLAGVMLGFRERMKHEHTAHEGEGLVWAGDADLKGYLRARHPHIRHMRHQGNRRTQAREHGKQAGRDIILRRPIDAPVGNGGRLLPPRSR